MTLSKSVVKNRLGRITLQIQTLLLLLFYLLVPINPTSLNPYRNLGKSVNSRRLMALDLLPQEWYRGSLGAEQNKKKEKAKIHNIWHRINQNCAKMSQIL